jgi:hypothetical protein
MKLGALYDIVLGLLILAALQLLAGILPIPMPHQPFYARMAGLLLIGLGGFYALAGLDIERHLRLVPVAISVRAVGGAYIALYPLLDGSVSWFFIVFGALDIGWAAVHLALLRAERGIGFWPLLIRGELRARKP